MESIDIKKTDKEKIVNTYARYDLAVKQGKSRRLRRQSF